MQCAYKATGKAGAEIHHCFNAGQKNEHTFGWGAAAPQTPGDVRGGASPCPTYEGKWGSNIIIVCQRYDLPNWIRCFDFLPKSACSRKTRFPKKKNGRSVGRASRRSGGRGRSVGRAIGGVGGRTVGRSEGRAIGQKCVHFFVRACMLSQATQCHIPM